jgi:hypothetical protein
MITALLLIFDSSATWEKIGTQQQQQNVWRIFFSYLLPLLLLSVAAESFGLLKFGMYEGDILPRLVKPSQELVTRYEAVKTLLDLVIIFGGAWLLKKVGEGFHRKHPYRDCFATLAYSLGPFLLARMLEAIPAINSWICYTVGILLLLSALYTGIPRVMKPDPSNALGVYLIASFSLIVITALAHFLSLRVLEQKALAHGLNL